MEIELKENERIDDLEYKGLKIIQNETGFCFGIDSILLSDFAKNLKKNSKVADFGTGTGIISILLAKKSEAKEIYGIEIQDDVAEMAQRSVKLNHLEDKIRILNIDLRKLDLEYGNRYFDVVVTNPPYKKVGTGLLNEDEKKLISRHEIKCSLEDLIKQAFIVLKDKGEFYMVHRSDRMVDVLCCMREYKIEPKELRLIYSNKNSEKSKLFLIKGIKNGNIELKLHDPLYIYNEDGTYTDQILEIYGKKK